MKIRFWGTRLAGDPGPGRSVTLRVATPRAWRWRSGRWRCSCWTRESGIRPLGEAIERGLRTTRHPAHHLPGSHPGPGLLRPALLARARGAPLGSVLDHPGPAGAVEPLSVPALFPVGSPITVLADPARRHLRAQVPDRTSRDQRRARVPSGPDGGLPDPRGRRDAGVHARPRALPRRRLPRDRGGLDSRRLARPRSRPPDPRRRSSRRRSIRSTWAGDTAPSTRPLAFAARGRVAQLVPFHHDPSHSDEILGNLYERAVRAPGSCPFELRRQRKVR